MEKPWKVIAAFVGIFVAGAVFGGFFVLRAPRPAAPIAQLPPAQPNKVQVAGPHLVAPAPAPRSTSPITPVLMRQLQKELKLTAAQREKMAPIVGRAGEDFQRLREEEARRRQDNLADVARVNERMYADVSNLLSNEQRVQLQEMRQRIEDRLQAEKQKRADELTARAKEAKEKTGERPAAPRTGPENPK